MMVIAHPAANVMMVVDQIPVIYRLYSLKFPSVLLDCPEHDLVGLLRVPLVVGVWD